MLRGMNKGEFIVALRVEGKISGERLKKKMKMKMKEKAADADAAAADDADDDDRGEKEDAADAADAAADDDEFDDDDSRRSPAKPRSPRAPTKSLREGLFWLRDRLAAMPPTRGARHDIAAELVHFHAHCSRYWVVSTSSHHQALRADPIEVRENEVHSYGVGAEGASDRVVSRIEKTYKPGTAAGSLLTWYKQDQARSIHWSPYDRVRVVNADP